jgi:hypothetical protein
MAARQRQATLLLLAALAACASPPAPFEPPPLRPEWSHHAGPLLTGPLLLDVPPDLGADLSRALALQVRLLTFEDLPPAGRPRLASRARLVLGDAPGRTVHGVAYLASGAMVAEGQAARDVLAKVDDGEFLPASATAAPPAALLPGTTAVLSLPFPPGDAGYVDEARLFITSGDVLTVALGVRGTPPESEEMESLQISDRELVVLQPPLPADGTPLVLSLPLPRPDHPRAALVLAVSAQPGSAADSSFVQAVADAVRAVHEASRDRRVAATELTADEVFLRQVVSAFGVLRDEASQRSALSFLAGASDARLCGDLVLIADADTLAELSARIEEGGRDLESLVAQGGGLGWLLERSTLLLLADRAAEEPLPPELHGILLVEVGEPGRFAASLQDVVLSCGSLTALRERLVLENRIFLEDNTASSRARAFDWLRARGQAPAGYDPFAPLAARRAALAAAEEAAAQAAAEATK